MACAFALFCLLLFALLLAVPMNCMESIWKVSKIMPEKSATVKQNSNSSNAPSSIDITSGVVSSTE